MIPYDPSKKDDAFKLTVKNLINQIFSKIVLNLEYTKELIDLDDIEYSFDRYKTINIKKIDIEEIRIEPYEFGNNPYEFGNKYGVLGYFKGFRENNEIRFVC